MENGLFDMQKRGWKYDNISPSILQKKIVLASSVKFLHFLFRLCGLGEFSFVIDTIVVGIDNLATHTGKH